MFVLIMFITLAVLTALITWLARRVKKNREETKERQKREIANRVSKMSFSDIDVRLSILFDELEDCYSPEKAMEYEVLLSEYFKRKKE